MAGYKGVAPVPQATQTRQVFTMADGQTDVVTMGYQPGYVDVYLNGVRLVDGDDYTAADGATVSLGVAAAADDVLEVVAFTAFEVSELTYALAGQPAYYERDRKWKVKNNTTSKNVLVSPSFFGVNINNVGHVRTSAVEIDITAAAIWDTTTPTDYTTASNRAGKDFYIYACQQASRVPKIVLSADASTPDGYTSATSRKIGGFHCLSVSVGANGATTNGDVALWPLDDVYESHNITGNTHWLNGYTAGDVLPFSVWDLLHRPASQPEGMRYVPFTNLWKDIYMSSWNGSEMESVNGGTIADGASSPEFHWYNFVELLGQKGKRLEFRHEFMLSTMGCPQGVNVAGSADQNTTGGHTATNGKRIVSLTGGEDEVGVMWQWGADAGATNDQGSTWEPADTLNTTWEYTAAANPEGDTGTYDHIEGVRRGGHYEDPNRPLLGGDWGAASICGSRAASWNYRALFRFSGFGARGVAEPV